MKPHDIITDRIIGLLEEGTVPWRKPWTTHAGAPRNLISRKSYRGINAFLLHSLGYESPFFLTYLQAMEQGGHVRKGEKGSPVVFWKWNWQPKSHNEEEHVAKTVPLLRYYTVFNVTQCDGITPPTFQEPERHHEPFEAAEAIVDGMPGRPVIEHASSQAAYSPLLDVVRMPRPELFESTEAYYGTFFHELVHSTGHSKRLDRKLDTTLAPFGSADYSREELVAEMGAAFLLGEAGITEPRLEQSAAYIDGWLRRLKSDKRLVIVAAAQAQKAADYIVGGKDQEASGA